LLFLSFPSGSRRTYLPVAFPRGFPCSLRTCSPAFSLEKENCIPLVFPPSFSFPFEALRLGRDAGNVPFAPCLIVRLLRLSSSFPPLPLNVMKSARMECGNDAHRSPFFLSALSMNDVVYPPFLLSFLCSSIRGILGTDAGHTSLFFSPFRTALYGTVASVPSCFLSSFRSGGCEAWFFPCLIQLGNA